MGVDYRAVSGIGVEVSPTEDISEYIEEEGICLEEFIEEKLPDGYYFETGGDTYSSEEEYFVFISEPDFNELGSISERLKELPGILNEIGVDMDGEIGLCSSLYII